MRTMNVLLRIGAAMTACSAAVFAEIIDDPYKPVEVEDVLKLSGDELTEALETIDLQHGSQKEYTSLRVMGLHLWWAGFPNGLIVGPPERRPVTFDGLLRIIDHAAKVSKARKVDEKDLDRMQYPLIRVMERALELAPEDRFDEVAGKVADLGFDDYSVMRLMTDVIERSIRGEIAAIQAELGAPLDIPLVAVPFPEDQAGSTPELREAWLRYMALRDRGVEERKDQPWVDFSADREGLLTLVARLCRGERKGIADVISRYRHGQGCLVDGNLSRLRDSGRWLALLRERRLKEAVGAAFEGGMSDDQNFSLRRDLLAACRLDAAQLSAGWLLARNSKWNSGYGFWSSDGRNQVDWEAEGLARGSERDVRFALDLLQIAIAGESARNTRFMQGERAHYLGALEIIMQRDGVVIAELPPLPESLRSEARAAMLAFLAGSTHPIALEAAIEKSGKLKLRAAAAPLRGLLTHWAPNIPQKAAAALRAMGEAVEDPARTGPVRFQLIAAGRPLVREKVWVDVGDSRVPYGYSEPVGHLETDGKGVLSIERTHLARPEARGQRITFTAVPDRPPLRVGKPPVALFAVSVPIPESLDEVARVEIDARPVTLKLQRPRPEKFYAGREVLVCLNQLDLDFRRKYSRAAEAWWWLSVRAEIVLPVVQPGTYALEVHAPGSAPWKIERFDVNAKLETVAVELAPATDVTFRLVASDGSEVRTQSKFLKDGEEFRPRGFYEKGELVHHGFAPGHYVLRIAGTAEWKAGWRRDPNEIRKPEPEYKGREIPFEIPASSPAALDLGKVVLERDPQ